MNSFSTMARSVYIAGDNIIGANPEKLELFQANRPEAYRTRSGACKMDFVLLR
jgi:hypothetical protein